MKNFWVEGPQFFRKRNIIKIWFTPPQKLKFWYMQRMHHECFIENEKQGRPVGLIVW